MEAPVAQWDPMLERAVRLGALTARLPALPVHDWLDRAADVMAEVAPGATVLALLLGSRGTLERVGAAGPGSESLNRDPRAVMRRVDEFPPMPPRELVMLPAPAYLRVRLGERFAEAGGCLMASAPLACADSGRLMLIVACEAEAQVEPVLWLAMPDLVVRALVALGPTPCDSAQWLLPGDIQLIEGLVAGKTIPEIARECDRKEHAVQDAIKAMYRRLGRNRRTDLVARAVGYVPASEIEGKLAPDSHGAHDPDPPVADAPEGPGDSEG